MYRFCKKALWIVWYCFFKINICILFEKGLAGRRKINKGLARAPPNPLPVHLFMAGEQLCHLTVIMI